MRMEQEVATEGCQMSVPRNQPATVSRRLVGASSAAVLAGRSRRASRPRWPVALCRQVCVFKAVSFRLLTLQGGVAQPAGGGGGPSAGVRDQHRLRGHSQHAGTKNKVTPLVRLDGKFDPQRPRTML